MMAYAEIEPFGPLADQFRTGQVCATVANVHRDPKSRPEPWSAIDFMPALERAAHGARSQAVLLDDPVAQANLIRQQVFGVGAP